jgi:predicted HTH domain antitoxin
VILSIPEEIVESSKIPPNEREKEFLKELAIALYASDVLTFGKARTLAKMSKWEFEEILEQRLIPHQYQEKDLDEDMRYGLGNQ